MKRYANELVATALVLLLAVNHLALGGRLAVDLLAIGCTGLYYSFYPPKRSR